MKYIADCRQRQGQRQGQRQRQGRRQSMTPNTFATTKSFSFLLSVLFLLKYYGSHLPRSALSSLPTIVLSAEAFAPPTTASRSVLSEPLPQQQHNRKRSRHGTRPSNGGFPFDSNCNTYSNCNIHSNSNSNIHSNSNTALGFFNFRNNKNKNANYNEGEPDLPLARYVDVSANYTLSHTPEDYIDLRDDQRLVCVGDVHGDLGALKQFLVTAGVYDPNSDSWCGGDTVLVQCGDVLDRGFEELVCYQLLARLSHQACAAGGRLVLLVGNHEILNAMGLFQYACTDQEHEQYIGTAVDRAINGDRNKWRVQYVGNQPSRWASYEPGGLLAYSLMRNMKVAIRVGRTVCVHAGLKPDHLKDHGGIEGMNRAYRDWITLGEDQEQELGGSRNGNGNGFGSGSGSAVAAKLKADPLVYNHHGVYPARLGISPKDQPWIDAEKKQTFYLSSVPSFLGSTPQDPGPTWMRDYSSPPNRPPNDPTGELEARLDETLLLLDADRMVVGHTIQARINAAFSGKVWRIDVGASIGCVGGTPEILEVIGNREGPESVSVLTSKSLSTASNINGNGNGNGNGAVISIPALERTIDSYAAAVLDVL